MTRAGDDHNLEDPEAHVGQGCEGVVADAVAAWLPRVARELGLLIGSRWTSPPTAVSTMRKTTSTVSWPLCLQTEGCGSLPSSRQETQLMLVIGAGIACRSPAGAQPGHNGQGLVGGVGGWDSGTRALQEYHSAQVLTLPWDGYREGPLQPEARAYKDRRWATLLSTCLGCPKTWPQVSVAWNKAGPFLPSPPCRKAGP